MIRVRIDARSEIIRAGLNVLLERQAEISIVSEADGADVILMDAPDPEILPDASQPAVVLTDAPDGAWLAEALRSGIRGLLPRSATPDEIAAAIRAAAAGLTVLHPSFAARYGTARLSTGIVDGAAEALTPRETDVLQMLAEGLPNKTIAYRLGISEHTVKFHVSSIFSKLNVSSRTEAVTLAARLGLILL
jgi:DNA-binding NarL/FixJ family response regulator